ncbi:MAG: hypothetical protein U0136_16885 [Bdellovibrionota bacterium]
MIAERRSKRTLGTEGAESGVVLLLLSMLIFAIIMVAALALDFSQMSVSSQEATNYAKFSALSALQAYSNAPKDMTTQAKLDRAIQAANDVGSLNLVLNVGGQQHADTVTNTGATNQPALVAGKYYAEAPTSSPGCTNPCVTGENAPCFVPLQSVKLACEPTGTTEALPNAFRVTGKYFSNVHTILAQAFTSGTYSVNVDEIAAFTPRRAMMMVDISDSMFRQTHSQENAHQAFYAYFLGPDNAQSTSGYDSSWAALQNDRANPVDAPPAPSDPEYANVHYKSDYQLVTPLRDNEFNNDPDYAKYHPNPNTTGATVNYHADQFGGNYRIDKFRDANYAGPEPFNTVFAGLDSAVTAFKERAVTGDRLGLIFFDTTVSWPRVVNLTSDFDYIERFTKPGILNDPTRGLDFLLKHGIFPANNNRSNLMLAINEAMNQFTKTQALTVPSVDFMVYFGDGLANCAQNLPPEIAADGPCGDDYMRYHQAMTEVRSFALNTLYPRRIPFNVILVGQHVRPHWLEMSDGKGGCMNDTDARNTETQYVRGDSYTTPTQWRNAYWGMSSSHPFYQVNEDMYQVARITGGVWGPLQTHTDDPNLCTPHCTATTPQTAERMEYSCDNTTTAINEYIANIMGSNPFMIVPHS